MLYRVLSSLGRVNVTTEKMNIVEDKVSVLKLGSGPVLNLKKGIRRLLGHSSKNFGEKASLYLVFESTKYRQIKLIPFFRDFLVWKRKPKWIFSCLIWWKALQGL